MRVCEKRSVSFSNFMNSMCAVEKRSGPLTFLSVFQNKVSPICNDIACSYISDIWTGFVVVKSSKSILLTLFKLNNIPDITVKYRVVNGTCTIEPTLVTAYQKQWFN